MATTSRRDNPRRQGPGAGKVPKGLPNPFNRGFPNPFNRGNNETGGRLRASRNAVRQELLREGRRKGVFGNGVRAVDGQADDSDWGAMFEFDPDLVAAFDKNMRVSCCNWMNISGKLCAKGNATFSLEKGLALLKNR